MVKNIIIYTRVLYNKIDFQKMDLKNGKVPLQEYMETVYFGSVSETQTTLNRFDIKKE